MTFRKLHTVVAVVALVLVGGAAWWLQNRAGSGGAGAASVAAGPPAQGASPSGAGPGATRAAPGPGGPGGPGGSGAGGGQGPAAVEVSQVVALRLEDDVQAVGSLRARQGVILRPEVSGRIAKLAFNDGQRVKKGQLLVQLDDTLQAAQLAQSEAQASIAATNLKRSRELQAQNFVSQSAVDQNTAALEVAQAQVNLSKAQMARMRILAPFDGALGIRSVNVGDYLKDGADIVSIEDTGSVWADFRVPESAIARLKLQQPVEITVEAMPGAKFTGRVDALDSQLDASARSMLVRARVDNASGTLRSGMFVRTRVVFSVRENALVVPEEALVPLGSKQFLFKVVDGPKGKVAQRVEAALGVRVPGKVEILSGVAVGDMIVTAGQQRLLRGDMLPVRPVELDKVGGERGPRGAGRGPGGAASGSAAPGAASGPGPQAKPGAGPAGKATSAP
jgi:membrane fusion protein, multidrug efflux system